MYDLDIRLEAAPGPLKRGMRLLHGHDIYEGFRPAADAPDLQGWGGRRPVFAELLEERRPATIVEVGTWKGQSAVHMAAHLKRLGLADSEIICVDTWLGSLEQWPNRKRPTMSDSLRPAFGYPTLYYQFLANVVLEGLCDMITPCPLPSLTAAAVLEAVGIKADLIYIDASHDYDSVKGDLAAFWGLLEPGGLMFGDDYTRVWPGVVRAVDEFAAAVGRRVARRDEKWILR